MFPLRTTWTYDQVLYYQVAAPCQRAPTSRKVFALNAEEATQFDDLIQGKCEVNGKTLIVPYNFGAIHFFISHDCADRLGLSMSELPYMLIVSTLAGKAVKTYQCCLNFHFLIDGRSFVANLICLPLSGLDLILSMDWLSANHAMINCFEKSIMLPPIPVELVEPICLFLNSVKVGSSESDNQGYVLLMESDVELNSSRY